jgi:hypothetical protein
LVTGLDVAVILVVVVRAASSLSTCKEVQIAFSMDGPPRPPVSASLEPEVAPVSTLILSPLLQDPKFLVSVLVVLAAVAFWYMRE